MKIRGMVSFLDNSIRNTKLVLNDTILVIDAHNYFYNSYIYSKLQSLFGCESEKYANYLREMLSIFQKANVKCYFIFKGGNENDNKLLNLDPMYEDEFLDVEKPRNPLFAREIYKQVLDEMGFDYAICEYVSKTECVALAQKLNCPVLSQDIEFFFYGIPYLSIHRLHFNKSSNILECRLYKLDDLMETFQVGIKEIAFYITILNENVFPSKFVEHFLKKLGISLYYKTRHSNILQWLSHNRGKALATICKCVSREEFIKIKSEIEDKSRNYIKLQIPEGLPSKYLLNKDLCKISNTDPDWFAKGIVWNFIPIPYINIYRWRIVEGSWNVEDYNARDSLLLSAPIIRYAFDLLTNFKGDKITYKGRRCRRVENVDGVSTVKDAVLEILPSIRKPCYGTNNVFESGWDNILDYKLFEHFLVEYLQLADVNKLKKVPRDAALLVISLLYFSHQKEINVDDEVHAILLSYVMLGLLSDETIADDTLNKNDLTSAKTLLDEYFYITDNELIQVYDKRILHKLVEFQHCLRHINFLNTLCGSPFPATIYSKTYNGTFVYNILYNMKKSECNMFLDEKLQNISTVKSYLKKLVDLYNELK